MPDSGMDSSIQGALSQISIELGRQSTQLAVITTKLDSVTSNTTDHENRLRLLETAKAKIIGAGIAAGAISGTAATLIYWALTHNH